MTNRDSQFFPKRTERGSILVMVIAGLAVVGLVMTTLAYTARVENQAAANWAEGLQARMSAVTGAPHFMSDEAENLGRDGATTDSLIYDSANRIGTNEPDVTELVRLQMHVDSNDIALDQERARQVTLDPHRRRRNGRIGGADLESLIVESSIAYSFLEDTSAKININTLLPIDEPIGTEDDEVDEGYASDPITRFSTERFAEFIDRILEIQGIESELSGSELARVIMEHRYGPDGEAGEAGVDDDVNGPDVGSRGSVRRGGEVARNHEQDENEHLNSLQYDGLDNDRDGSIDEPGESIETDGLDNDFNGEVDESGEATDDPFEYESDLRREPNGDDSQYHRLDELKSIEGMTPETFEAISPFLTVFSIARPATPRRRGHSVGMMKLDPNTASAEDMFRVLRARYPQAAEALLGQYVANLVDRRDTDNYPSELVLGSAGVTYFGRELTPYINEVFPDSPTYEEDGDDGQYVEIINPYSVNLSLAGWTLETGSYAYLFVEDLPAHSYLIITDDFDETNDPDPTRLAGLGSMYDIFGYVPLGTDEQYSVDPFFDIPDERGTINLFDANRNLIDSFTYSGGVYAGVLNSFQRADPQLREYQWTAATPFKPNADADELIDPGEDDLLFIEELHNRPFRSPLEMLLISTSFAGTVATPVDGDGEDLNGVENENENAPGDGEDVDVEGRPDTNHFRRLPSIDYTGPNNLDAKIMDAFLPGVPARRRDINALNARNGDRNRDRSLRNDQTPEEALARYRLRAKRRPPVLHGQINLNTASPAVLAFLPGGDEELAMQIALARSGEPAGDQTDEQEINEPALSLDEFIASPEWFQTVSPIDEPRWESLASLLRDDDLWGEDELLDRIVQIYPFSRLITFHSLSYKITTANIPNPIPEGSAKRRSSVFRVERLVAGDTRSVSNVKFRFLPRRPIAADDNEDAEDDDGSEDVDNEENAE